MDFTLFDYQVDYIRQAGMCPRKVDSSQSLCPPDKCLECKEEAKKALLEDARGFWYGERKSLEGETFERELQNIITGVIHLDSDLLQLPLGKSHS